MMDSKEVKTKLLHFWRFGRRYRFISTESGRYKADVLISNGFEIIECEVKISKADLKQDFKKRKHGIYAKNRSILMPNKFYFAVPEHLADFACSLVEDTDYGVISIEEGKISRKWSGCSIVKRAKFLTRKYCDKLEHKIIMRMGSELIRFRMKGYGYGKFK